MSPADKELSYVSVSNDISNIDWTTQTSVSHTIAIFNNGKSTITDEDFKGKPIKIKFPKDVNILNHEIDYRSDENIGIDLTLSKNELWVLFDFLNRWEGFVLKIIVDWNNWEFKVSWRVINGVLEQFSVPNMKGNLAKFTWFLATTWAIVLCLILYFFLNLIDSVIAKFVLSLGIVSFIFIIPLYVWSKWKEWLSKRFIGKEFYNRIISPNYELSYDDIVFDWVDDEIKKSNWLQ